MLNIIGFLILQKIVSVSSSYAKSRQEYII
jgi:hypothetical protein